MVLLAVEEKYFARLNYFLMMLIILFIFVVLLLCCARFLVWIATLPRVVGCG